MFERITFFDVETPNRNNHRMCSIGIVHWVKGEQVLAKEWLVQPDCSFDSFNVRLHGVSPAMVADRPNFEGIWQEIHKYFEDTLVVAHNAAFDVSVLDKVLDFYALEKPSFHYACTVQMAKRRLPKQPFNLAALSASLNVVLSRHHNALADTLACAGIFRHLIGIKPIKASDYKPYGEIKATPAQLKEAANPSRIGEVVGQPVGSRGLLFSFDHIGMATTVYAINGKEVIYIVDTYLGPDVMEAVDHAIQRTFGLKPKVVINTHGDWDHIWGNCRYGAFPIVGHELCEHRIAVEGEKHLRHYGEEQGLALGNVTLVAPNLTFSERLTFKLDHLVVFYSPGHTIDSISVWDPIDRVLVAGDNLEWPHPVLQNEDLALYQKTLEGYLELPIEVVIAGHTGVETRKIIDENLKYIKACRI